MAKSTIGVGSINGVGTVTKKKLLSGGFDTIERIAEATPSQISSKCGIRTEDAKGIIKNAKSMFNPRTVARLNNDYRELWAEYNLLRKNYDYVCYENTLLKRDYAGLEKNIEKIEKEMREKLDLISKSEHTAYVPTEYNGDMYR